MNIRTKKIIAREFLYTILFLLLGAGFYYSIVPYNYYLENKKNKRSTEINKLTSFRDSLASLFEEKRSAQEWFCKQVTAEYEVYNVNNVDVLWNRFLEISNNDSIEIKWEGKWKEDNVTNFFEKIGFSNPDSLDNFIKKNSYSKFESSTKQKVENINSKISILNRNIKSISIISHSEQIDFLKKFMLALLILLFGLRHTYCVIRWSIKILRE